MYSHNGVLIYDRDNDLQAAFYNRVCDKRILTMPSDDITKSYISAEIELQRSIILPNIFVVSEEDDRFFSWKLYQSQHCFSILEKVIKGKGLELKLHNIVETKDMQARIYGSRSAFEAGLLECRRQGKLPTSYCNEVVGKLNIKDILRHEPAFKDLVEALSQ